MPADISIYIFRTLLLYLLIFLTLRVMGKREIGKLSIFDLVISIMIAEIAVFVLEDIKRPLYEGIVPMATLVVVQVLIAYLSLKNRKIRQLFDGKPTVLISDGNIHRDAMKKQRYNLDDLMFQMRGQNIDNIAEVEFAILETTGQLTVIPKDSQSAKNKKSNKKILIPAEKVTYTGLPIPLIMDGIVQDESLKIINKTRFWLKNQIHSKGAEEFSDVFFCSIDHKGELNVDLLDKPSEPSN
ncbi:MAG TPA: DUF421 domain-containing protein [Paenibacillus sp.]